MPMDDTHDDNLFVNQRKVQRIREAWDQRPTLLAVHLGKAERKRTRPTQSLIECGAKLPT
jgi:hypothetical protein